MAAADRPESAEQRMAGKRQIADRIEQLMANEFLRIAQSFAVHYAIIADDGRADGLDQAAAGFVEHEPFYSAGYEGACRAPSSSPTAAA